MSDGSEDMPKNGVKLNDVSIKTGPMLDKPIKFDHAKKEQLRDAYLEAEGTTSFYFEGQELLTSYAGYLLEYLDTRIN
jgi:hypothetical protein